MNAHSATAAENEILINHILDNCVLGDNVTVGGGNRLAYGARLWSNRQLEPNTIFILGD